MQGPQYISNNIKAFIRDGDDSEAECNQYSSDLIFIEGINIYFLRTNNKIIEDFEFEYEEKSDNTNTIPIFNEGKENTNTIIIPDTNPNQNTLNEINILKLDKTKEEILQDINTIMKDVNIEETYEYTTKGFNLLIYPINSKLIENKTHIDLSECEYTLKQYYQLPNDSIIAFFQMEISNTNERSLINQVEYQAFDKDKNPLDMSKCNDSIIKILYGIKNNSDLDLSVLDSFKDSGVNVFNISDEFFNDICVSYSENGNDLILEDRIKDIYQNFTICEEGCTYEDIDIYKMLISCQCNIKENMTTEIKEINDEKIVEKISSLNFEIIKCYNLAFSLKGKFKNYGFWILSIFVLLYIICLIKYCCSGITPLKDYIFNEMTKFGYINKNSSNGNKLNFAKRKKLNIKKKTKNELNNNPPKKKTTSKKKATSPIDRFTKKTNKKMLGIKNKSSIINNINITSKISNKKILSLNNNKNIANLDLNLISINLNNLSKRDISPKESSITLYNYTMLEAFKYDRRNIIVIFYIYLLSKEPFFHAFLYKSPLVLFPLRFCLLLFIISSDLALNAFFYFNDNISRKYRNTKNIFIFTLSNNMTVILLSTLVTFIFLTLFTNLSNTTKDLRDVFKNEENKIRKNKNYKVSQKQKDKIKKNVENILQKYKCKIFILFFVEIIFMLFFWYYTVVFCHVFSGTQISWIINSILSMKSRIIIDVLICLLFSKLYKIGVSANYTCIYKIALFFYGF